MALFTSFIVTSHIKLNYIKVVYKDILL